MKQVNVSCSEKEGASQAVLVWPGGIHGGKKPIIFPLGMSDVETEAIRDYLEKRLGHPEQD